SSSPLILYSHPEVVATPPPLITHGEKHSFVYPPRNIVLCIHHMVYRDSRQDITTLHHHGTHKRYATLTHDLHGTLIPVSMIKPCSGPSVDFRWARRRLPPVPAHHRTVPGPRKSAG